MITLIFMLAVIGAVLWWVHQHAPIHAAIKALIVLVGVLWCAYLVLQFFGLISGPPLRLR